MPLVKLTAARVYGQSVYAAGQVIEMDARQAERFVKAGQGVVVPPGTPADPEPDPAPEHETADAKRPDRETAALRRK